MLRALFFDVFGTCVDWRSGVAREVAALAGRRGGAGDAEALADAWRGEYQPQMQTVRDGSRPWTTLDVLHRESLDRVLAGTPLDAAGDADRDALTLAWHRLDPWPDAVPALVLMRERYVVAPNSNGNIALLLDMARRARLPWDVILGAETARAYKPLPEAYLRNVAAIGASPDQVMMVAAHNDDLAAAAACGLRTAFVARPAEHGPAQTTDLAPTGDWDHAADDLLHLAEMLCADPPPAGGTR